MLFHFSLNYGCSFSRMSTSELTAFVEMEYDVKKERIGVIRGVRTIFLMN